MDAGSIVKRFLDRWDVGIEETRAAFRDTLTQELNADGKIVQWRDYFDSKSLG